MIKKILYISIILSITFGWAYDHHILNINKREARIKCLSDYFDENDAKIKCKAELIELNAKITGIYSAGYSQALKNYDNIKGLDRAVLKGFENHPDEYSILGIKIKIFKNSDNTVEYMVYPAGFLETEKIKYDEKNIGGVVVGTAKPR